MDYSYNPSISEIQQELQLILAEAANSKEPVTFMSSMMKNLHDLIRRKKKPYQHQSPDWDDTALITLYNLLRTTSLGRRALVAPSPGTASAVPLLAPTIPSKLQIKEPLELRFEQLIANDEISLEEASDPLFQHYMALAAFLEFTPARNLLENLSYPEEPFPETLRTYVERHANSKITTISYLISDSLFAASEFYARWRDVHLAIGQFRNAVRHLDHFAYATAKKLQNFEDASSDEAYDDYVEKEEAKELEQITSAYRHEVITRAVATTVRLLFHTIPQREFLLLHNLRKQLNALLEEYFHHQITYLIEISDIRQILRVWRDDAPSVGRDYEKLEAQHRVLTNAVGAKLTSLEPVIEMLEWTTSSNVDYYLEIRNQPQPPQYFVNEFHRHRQHFSQKVDPQFLILADSIIYHPQRNSFKKAIQNLIYLFYIFLGILGLKTYFHYIVFHDESGTKMRDAAGMAIANALEEFGFRNLYPELREDLIRWAVLEEEPLNN